MKKYGYSAQEEEKKLNAVLKDVGIKSADTIGKKLSKIGIRNVPEVNDYDDGHADEQHLIKNLIQAPDIMDKARFFASASPKADTFKLRLLDHQSQKEALKQQKIDQKLS